MTDYKTDYSNDKNINTLQRGSFNDWGDGTPARQSLVKQAPGEVFEVNVLSESGETTISYDEVSCPVGAETLIVSYTVPVGEFFSLKRILVGGDNIAKYIIKLNGSPIATARTWWTRFNETVAFDNLKLNADDIISVHAINRGTSIELFEASILGDPF